MSHSKSSAGASAPASTSATEERRRYPAAREAFEYAYSILEPFHHPEAGWQGRSLHHLSFGLVRGNFPHLAYEETYALLEAVTRVFSERHSEFFSGRGQVSAG